MDTKGQRNPPETFSEERRAPRRAEKVLSYPYSLKLGSFRTLKQVEKSITLYNKKNLSPYWVKVELKGKGVWYRVFTGHFAESEQAEKFRLEHRLAESIVKKIRYANLIGVYTSQSELNNKILSLKNLGYSPYVIKDPDGKSRLIVGAFLTKAGAEQLYDRLKSNRIQSQVINR